MLEQVNHDATYGLRRWASVLLLVAVNLMPVAFLVTGSWEPGDVLLAYWLENLVVGAFGVVKILTARGATAVGARKATGGWTLDVGESMEQVSSKAGRIGLAAFFVVHFGLFTVVHGVFTSFLAVSIGISGSLREWGLMVLALVASHGLSLWLHWIRGDERSRTSPSQAMSGPYARIFVLHLVVLGSFFLAFSALADLSAGNDPSDQRFIPALALIAVKTVVDVVTHLREHRDRARPFDI